MTENYSHILIATDLLEDNSIVCEKALAIAKQDGAKISAIHVVENVPLYFGNELVLPETQEIEQQLLEQSKVRMEKLAKTYELDTENCHVELGVTKLEILDFAKENRVDLVVIGKHSRHGLEHLLGSTARGIVNSAPCDVLTVKIR